MKWLVTMCFLAIAPIAAQSGPPAATALISALQGTWTITQVNGKSLSGLGQYSSITFTRDAYSVTTNGKVMERGTIKIDAARKPTAIDMRITAGIAAGRTQIGVIQVLDGTLMLKTSTIGSPERPTDFKVDPVYVLFVAKKN